MLAISGAATFCMSVLGIGEIRHLEILSGLLKCSLGHAKCFCRSANDIFGKVGRIASNGMFTPPTRQDKTVLSRPRPQCE